MSYSTGTNNEVFRLIELRVANDTLFTGKRNISKKAWKEITRLPDMGDRVTPIQVSKKWDNLKIQYKKLRNPPTGTGTDGREETAATWPFYAQMHETIGAWPSIEPPVLMDSCNPVDVAVVSSGGPSSPGAGAATSGSSTTQADDGPSTSACPPPPKKKWTSKAAILASLEEEAAKEAEARREAREDRKRALDLLEEAVRKF
ncbi:uncharacterized protein LOC126407109 [Epinephelus moara]|uniref:uncharacterized protein LOC126407109 n=1 Tax=Epinephelus moara TaxID=300413 RepID=UPI00214F4D6E|nr:uncharacterized protein LOC126407109 [Epinephelus moara]